MTPSQPSACARSYAAWNAPARAPTSRAASCETLHFAQNSSGERSTRSVNSSSPKRMVSETTSMSRDASRTPRAGRWRCR